MGSDLDALGNGQSLEACKEHEQICRLVSGEVPYVQLISRICFLIKICFSSASQSARVSSESPRLPGTLQTPS